ncbi:MAG: HAMP domain-containing sensor histidine kinase, partial [Ignavibacteria bacterium]|nr:HAMP domain-containing sensor histidine kinase [Ignavibacteria bacterium]
SLAKEKAEQSDKLKTEFLAQMSHEIRSPMNAIISFANILKEEFEEKVTPELKEYFDGIDSAGNRLMRTVDLMLNTSEMQVGTYVPFFVKVKLISEILDNVKSDYSKLILDKGLEFSFTSDVPEAVVDVDKYSIKQVFVNLIDNAFKYTKTGSISVKVERNKDMKFVKVTIEDTGIGMTEEFMTRMYKPFIQEDGGYSRRFEGNGLGLSLVKIYCELNKIEINVESKKGIGTKFTLLFAESK